MQLTYDGDEEDFRGSVRGFLSEHMREADVRALMETPTGVDRAEWRRAAEQLELPGLTVPESTGGAGYGPRELVLVFEELGAALAAGPYLGTAVLVPALIAAVGDDAAAARILPGIARGETLATVAVLGDTRDWDDAGDGVEATGRDGGWSLSGRKHLVVDAPSADLVLVTARTQDGAAVFAVETNAAGVSIDPLGPLDTTRKLGDIALDGAGATLVGVPGDADRAVAAMLEIATVALAAEQVGGAQRVLDTTVAYARDRVQFGRAIGSFQSIKHRLADMLGDVELARSAVYHAGWALATQDDEADLAVSLAATRASEAFLRAAETSIQIHGGIGFTWEHPAHLSLKRAKSSALLLRDPAFHAERLGRLLERTAVTA